MNNDFSLFSPENPNGHGEPVASGIPRHLAIVALGEIPGIGHSTAVRLYDTGSIATLFTANVDEIQWIAGTAQVPSPHTFAKTFVEHRERALEQASEEIRRLELNGVKLVLEDEPSYPPQMRDFPDKPRWLFVRGNMDLLSSERLITIVGTRQPTEGGLELARRVTRILVGQGFAIVSGLAEGIDAVAHQVTVENNGQTVAVLGTGIFNDFPAATAFLRMPILQTAGAIITEFFLKEQYSRQRFVQRNRIQAALSKVTIPVEASLSSGTMHTVRFAQQYKRTLLGVKAVGSTESELHNFLREEGFDVVDVPEVDDPFLQAIARNYNFRDFARESDATRRRSKIERAVRFVRSIIKSENLSSFEVAQLIDRIRNTSDI